MAARYKVRLKNTAGTILFETDEWQDLNYVNKVNDVGEADISIDMDSDLVQYFATDRILEIWREDEAVGLAWYRDWVGLMREPGLAISDDGRKVFKAGFVHINEFIARPIVAWDETTAQAEKADVGETVMKEYVSENVGSGATVGAGREAGGAQTGFNVEADSARGGAWAGDKHFQNLLDVLQEIALATDLRFEVVDTGVSGGIQTFEFRIHESQLGVDRSTSGLDPSTGLNGAGYAPVIWDIDRENLQALTFSVDRRAEITSALVLGQGETTSRLVLEVANAAAEAVSIWNHREAAVNANSEDGLSAMGDLGDAVLQQKQAKVTLGFTPLRTASLVYGSDFNFGDLVTARVLGVDYDVELLRVSINVREGNERISYEFGYLS